MWCAVPHIETAVVVLAVANPATYGGSTFLWGVSGTDEVGFRPRFETLPLPSKGCGGSSGIDRSENNGSVSVEVISEVLRARRIGEGRALERDPLVTRFHVGSRTFLGAMATGIPLGQGLSLSEPPRYR